MTATLHTAPKDTAKFRKFQFKRKDGSAWFERPNELSHFKKVPLRLRVEDTWQEHIRKNGAASTCHDGHKDGEHEFFTGLLPVPKSERIFVGNQRINGKTSLCIFRFDADFQTFELWHFNNFYLNDRATRFEWVRAFLTPPPTPPHNGRGVI